MLNRILPKGSRRHKFLHRLLFSTQLPRHISSNFTQIEEHEIAQIRSSLEEFFFNRDTGYFGHTKEHLLTDIGQSDLHEHLIRRLEYNRRFIIPWLDDSKTLSNSTVLEIGCGTGSTAVALAEQGVRVFAIDIDKEALIVAKQRSDLYGLSIHFYEMNATEAHELAADHHFDVVLFSASLEHMTLEERIVAMTNTWEMLTPGSLWCITDTPNRLWYHDTHTAQLPFYHWLPHDLAYEYCRYSPRKLLRDWHLESDKKFNTDTALEFLRWGRGVSFHEFELTMDRVERLHIVSSLPIYLRRKNIIRWLKWKISLDSHYEFLLSRRCPQVHRAFYQPNLDLILIKQ